MIIGLNFLSFKKIRIRLRIYGMITVNNFACWYFSSCHNFGSTNLPETFKGFHIWILKLSNLPSIMQHSEKWLVVPHLFYLHLYGFYIWKLSLKVKTDLTYYNLQKEVVLSILHWCRYKRSIFNFAVLICCCIFIGFI